MGLALGDLDPAAILALLNDRRARRTVPLQPLDDPFVDTADRAQDPATFGGAAHDFLERHARHDRVAITGMEHLAIALVAKDQAIGGIEQGEALRNTLHRIGQAALHVANGGFRPLALGGQALALRQAVAEQRERAGHGADLVAAAARNGCVELAAGDRLDRVDQAPERARDRAHDHHRQEQAEHARQHDHRDGDDDRFPGLLDRPLADRLRLGLQPGDEAAQQLVDRLDVLPCAGHQRVADHPLVLGVGVDRPERAADHLLDLAADLRNLGRRVRLEDRELPVQALARLLRPHLGAHQEADRQVRKPVFEVAERHVGVVGGLDQVDRLALLGQHVDVPAELAAEVEIGPDQHAEQHRGQQHQSGEDRESSHRLSCAQAAADGAARRPRRALARVQRNSVMLITPPRSSSWPPSIG